MRICEAAAAACTAGTGPCDMEAKRGAVVLATEVLSRLTGALTGTSGVAPVRMSEDAAFIVLSSYAQILVGLVLMLPLLHAREQRWRHEFAAQHFARFPCLEPLAVAATQAAHAHERRQRRQAAQAHEQRRGRRRRWKLGRLLTRDTALWAVGLAGLWQALVFCSQLLA